MLGNTDSGRVASGDAQADPATPYVLVEEVRRLIATGPECAQRYSSRYPLRRIAKSILQPTADATLRAGYHA